MSSRTKDDHFCLSCQRWHGLPYCDPMPAACGECEGTQEHNNGCSQIDAADLARPSSNQQPNVDICLLREMVTQLQLKYETALDGYRPGMISYQNRLRDAREAYEGLIALLAQTGESSVETSPPQYSQIGIKHRALDGRTEYLWWGETPPEGTPIFVATQPPEEASGKQGPIQRVCHALTQNCVMFTDPERVPCTPENCAAMRASVEPTRRHARECGCTSCHYSQKFPQVKPHHATCGCFECAPEKASGEPCNHLVVTQRCQLPKGHDGGHEWIG